MITICDLYKKWNSILPFSGGFLLVSDDHPLSFHIGYTNEQMCFMVLDTGEIKNLPSSKSISLKNIEIERGKYALQFILNYPVLDELFVKLCWDLMEISKKNEKPVNSIILRFNNWLRLLQKRAEGLLSGQSQKGLIGELLFLKDLVALENTSYALSSWVGPEGSDQDFVFENTWVEIKTTTIASSSVIISSIQQLDREEEGNLVVYFIDRSTSQSQNNFSLYDLVSEVGKLLPIDAVDMFYTKLAMYGYYTKDEECYQNIKFRLKEKRTYKVDNSFPKLTRKNIPSEVVNAEYVIDLLAIDSHKV